MKTLNKTLKTKKNHQKLEKKRLKQKINNEVKHGVKNGVNTKPKKRSLKYNKKGGGEIDGVDNFNQEYEKIDTNNGIKSSENFEGELRGLGDGLKINQPIGQGDNRQPMPEMPDCCIL